MERSGGLLSEPVPEQLQVPLSGARDGGLLSVLLQEQFLAAHLGADIDIADIAIADTGVIAIATDSGTRCRGYSGRFPGNLSKHLPGLRPAPVVRDQGISR